MANDKKSQLDQLFLQFQSYIYADKLHKQTLLPIPSKSLCATYLNPIEAKGFWLVSIIVFNLFSLYNVADKIDRVVQISAYVSMLALLITVASRAPLVNRFLFIITSQFKYYWLHQVIYRLGYLHRFMAITSFAWLALHLALKPILKPYIDDYLVASILLLMPIIILSALSIFRHRFHGWFEHIHRIFSYIALILLIAYFHIMCVQNGLNFTDYFFRSDFYILAFTLFFSISPWIGIKKIRPILQHAGSHVAAFKIKGSPQFGSFTRISLGDYQFHSFGDSIFDVSENNHYTLFITAAGDRTTEIVKASQNNQNLIEQCYMRRDRSYGFMYHLKAYDYVLVVATGGGIAPVLPHLTLNKSTQMIVLWLGHDQVKEFSNDFFIKLRAKMNTDNIRMHILNSTLPWVKQLTPELTIDFFISAFRHYCPEALFIVSNPALTEATLTACKHHKIRGYGATFDS